MAARRVSNILIGIIIAAALCALVAAVLRSDWFTAPAAGPVPEVRQLPDELLRYRQAASLATGLRQPLAIAAGPGPTLYVAGDKAVTAAGPIRSDDCAGVSVLTFAELPTAPTALVADDKWLYVASGSQVMRFDLEGKRDAAFRTEPLPGSALITSLAVRDQDLLVADAGNRTLWRLEDGKVAGKATGFAIPSPYFALAMAPDGLLRVAHSGAQRIEAYTPDTLGREFAWGIAGAGAAGFVGCCNPSHIAMLPDGRLVTSEKGQWPTVKVFRPDGPNARSGELDAVVAGPRQLGGGDGAWPVAVDASGRVYVLDESAATVRVFVRK
jgi:hypothetical protein